MLINSVGSPAGWCGSVCLFVGFAGWCGSVCLFVGFVCSCLMCVGDDAACYALSRCAALLLSCQLSMQTQRRLCALLFFWYLSSWADAAVFVCFAVFCFWACAR